MGIANSDAFLYSHFLNLSSCSAIKSQQDALISSNLIVPIFINGKVFKQTLFPEINLSAQSEGTMTWSNQGLSAMSKKVMVIRQEG